MNKLKVSVSPHIHSRVTTQKIMLDVIIALVPAAVAGCIIFGIRSLFVMLTSVAAAVLAELLFCLACKREITIYDLSAVVSGLILALSLPVTMPLWQVAVGAVFAIIIVKCIFGGIGQNFANPAVTARVFMIIAFSKTVAATATPKGVDAVSSATPLVILEGTAKGELPSIIDMLIGKRAGAIGETCVVALVIGGLYLMIKRVISWHTPVAFIASTFVFILIFTGDPKAALYHTLLGGLFIGAIFMATDYSTTPTNTMGKVVFGIGAGFITSVIRIWGSLPEGVSYAILLMNILTPYIEKLTRKKPLGGNKV